jgi:Family of unknown function (DUF6152)
MNPKRLSALVVGLFAVCVPLLAHHGSSVYDGKKLTTLRGTVVEYKFMNPHTELVLDVKDANGKIQRWTTEATSLVTMSRLGWTKNMFKAGDQITVTGNATKNGSFAMRLRTVVAPTGKEYTIDRGEDYAGQ